MNLDSRIKKLEEVIKPIPQRRTPRETWQAIEAVLIRAFENLPPRLRVHAEIVFGFGKEKTDDEIRTMLRKVAIALKLHPSKGA